MVAGRVVGGGVRNRNVVVRDRRGIRLRRGCGVGESHGGGLREDGWQPRHLSGGHDAGELDAAAAVARGRRAIAHGAPGGRGRARHAFAGRAGSPLCHGRRVIVGGASRRAGRSALTSVAAVGELVIVKTTCQFRLLEMRRNVLVGHLLEASLEEIVLL